MGFLISDNGRVGLDDNFVGIAVINYCTLLAPGMKLGVVSMVQEMYVKLLFVTIVSLLM